MYQTFGGMVPLATSMGYSVFPAMFDVHVQDVDP